MIGFNSLEFAESLKQLNFNYQTTEKFWYSSDIYLEVSQAPM